MKLKPQILIPLPATPGAPIPPASVVGRAALIAAYTRRLRGQDLAVDAERRQGKTSVLKKLVHELDGEHTGIYMDVSDCRSAGDFVRQVYREAKKRLSKKASFFASVRQVVSRLGGGDGEDGDDALGKALDAVSPKGWHELLPALFEDFARAGAPYPVFVWDELPYMLAAISKSAGEDEALRVLDVLRKIRHTHPRQDENGRVLAGARMIFTGSIGLHHVLKSLKTKTGLAVAPNNDMSDETVAPLDEAGARELAARLLLGEQLVSDEEEAWRASSMIPEPVDRVPYYIQHVVATLSKRREKPSAERVDAILRAALDDPSDPWHLRHYDQRLEPYYGSRAQLARAALNEVAKAGDVPEEQLENTLALKFDEFSRTEIRELLEDLVRDHYLVIAGEDRVHSFTYGLIRRWWIRYHRLDR